jgi:hypothetical protein
VTATVSEAGSVEWLAARIARSRAATLKILREFEARGIVVEQHGVWRLARDADESVGGAFRMLPLHEPVARDVTHRLPRSLR